MTASVHATWSSIVRTTRWDARLNTVDYMREAVLFDGDARRSQLTRFWLLLTLSSLIATVGVVTESTATVIGAMIVAPLMRPIQGTMLSTVLGEQDNLRRSITIMVLGALAAIGIGFVVGLAIPIDVTAASNDQVAGRVSPGVLDLLAALATGVVGSVALIRSDISDTLPGVAIAISLVPPLCVVGLTAEAGELGQSVGALLLFVTNVAAILATGSLVMAIYGFSRLRLDAAEDKVAERRRRRKSYLTTAAMVLAVSIPLTYSTAQAIDNRNRVAQVERFVEDATAQTPWSIVSIAERESDLIHVILKGEPPLPDMAAAYEAMKAGGLDPDTIVVEFIPSYTFDSDGPRDSL